MWNKKFVQVLKYLNIFKAMHKKQPTDALAVTKQKSGVDDSCLFQIFYSRTVTETVKKDVSGIKQKKWTPPLNSAYSNLSRYQISA